MARTIPGSSKNRMTSMSHQISWSTLLEEPDQLLDDLHQIDHPPQAYHLTLIQQLATWLDTHHQHPSLPVFLDRLSLELPPKLIHLAYATRRRGAEQDELTSDSDWSDHPALVCLRMFCRLGNPREVFMAITQTLSLLCHRFRHSEYQSQSDDDDDDDTEEEEDESLKGIDWGLAEALIEPLSLLLTRIFERSQKPTAFYVTYAQTFLAFFHTFPSTPSSSLHLFTSLVTQSVKIRDFAPSIDGILKPFLLVSACILLPQSDRPLAMARVWFSTRFPRWKSSLVRIVEGEGGKQGVYETDEDELRELVKGLRQVFPTPQTVLQAWGDSPDGLHLGRRASCEALSSVVVGSEDLWEMSRLGTFLVYALVGFGSGEEGLTSDEPKPTTSIEGSTILEGLADSSPTSIQASLFLIISAPRSSSDSLLDREWRLKVVENLAKLATQLPSAELRFLLFRTLAILLDRMDPIEEFESLVYLINLTVGSGMRYKKLEKALVNLVKERMSGIAVSERKSSRLWSREFLEKVLGLVEGTRVEKENVEVVVEKINFVYFVVNADVGNMTGIQSQDMRKNIIQHLIGPAERFLTEGLKVKSQDVDELKMMIGSLEFGLEMLKEMNWNDE